MKLSIKCFSSIASLKSFNIRRALQAEGVQLIPFKRLRHADGCIVYNIHHFSLPYIQESHQYNKPIVSLQEGMYATGWAKTLRGMKAECDRANKYKVMQFVWSRFEAEQYAKTGKEPQLLNHFGNPEYDDLMRPPTIDRSAMEIAEDAFVIVHIDQYAHPQGGPKNKHLNRMFNQVRELTSIHDKVVVISCLHPKQNRKYEPKKQCIVRPFSYPIFDILQMSNLIISVSSTEMITSAILEKPMIQYDISDSPERWPFSEHGVAIRVTDHTKLREVTSLIMEGQLSLSRELDYKQEYHVDGNTASNMATEIIRHFNGLTR